jgi:mono/diheme cytochrome c family protein
MPKRNLLAVACLTLFVTCAGPAPVLAQVKPPAQDYTSGGYLFQTFCASCHGTDGKGRGPMAEALHVPPTDLTRLSARTGGAFPRRLVSEWIDGRRTATAHGANMPVWGDALRLTQGPSEAIVRRRIEALVRHIESLQVEARK